MVNVTSLLVKLGTLVKTVRDEFVINNLPNDPVGNESKRLRVMTLGK